jgi:hypothetical protein
MPPRYRSIDIARDATAFASSKFGQHYIKRLVEAGERHRSAAKQLDIPKDLADRHTQRAAVYEGELEYFRIAEDIQRNPTLMNQLQAKLAGREAPDVN